MSTTNHLILEQHEMWFSLSGIIVLRPKRRTASAQHPRFIYLGCPEYLLPAQLDAFSGGRGLLGGGELRPGQVR